MRYPIDKATSLPGSGSAVYFFLLENIHIPAKLTHEIWLNGCKELVDQKDHPFQGYYPIGKTLKISYGGSPMMDHTFSKEDKNPVFVKELSQEAKMELGISAKADATAKVFNPFFLPYEELPMRTKKDNELPALSLAKSITSFLSSKDALFTEENIVNMLSTAIERANSDEMKHILHGNHVAWCASRFLLFEEMEEDIKKNFYSQNTVEFFIKDIGTIMPSILYAVAILGISPMEMIKRLNYDLWGIDKAAEAMEQQMLINQEVEKIA